MTRIAVVTIAHGRHEHLRLQRIGLARSTRPVDEHVVVAMDDDELAASLTGELTTTVYHVAADAAGLPLAAARNAGARIAIDGGAELVVFLDVDCVPDPDLVAGYVAAARDTACADRLLCGPVAYLPPPPDTGYDLDTLADLADPHPGRPAPAPGRVEVDDDHPELFWSLSFALSPATWDRLGGFDERYVGYGAEDTDLGYRAAECGIGLAWVGGARAFHQYHPVSRPPVEHAADLVRNGALFAQRWGFWPMRDWLEQLADDGVVAREPDGVGYRLLDSAPPPSCT